MINQDNSEGSHSHLSDYSSDRSSKFTTPSSTPTNRDSNFVKRIFEVEKKKFSSTIWRWPVLVCICMMFFGPYFSYYTLSTRYDQIISEICNDNDFKYRMIPTSYSILGVVFSILAGLFVVKKGLKLSIILFSSITVFSQILLVAAGYIAEGNNNKENQTLPYVLALIEFSLFGIGGEGLTVCCFSMICRWFEAQEISTSFGINLSIFRLSTLFNTNVIKGIESIGISFLIGLILCVFSFAFGIISIVIDAYSKKVDIRNKKYKEEDIPIFHSKDLFSFGKSFWILSVDCSMFYASFKTFNFVSDIFLEKHLGIKDSSFIVYIYLSCVLTAPFLGYIIDKKGYKVTCLMLANVMLMISHFMLIFIQNKNSILVVAIPLLLMAISYSLFYVCIWPSIPLVVKPEMVGYAYGLFLSVQNIGVAIGPLLTSAFRTDDEYIIMEIMLIIFAFLGFLSSLYLWMVDKKMYRSILQNPCIKVIKEPTDSYGLRRNSKTPSFKAKNKSPLISENKYQKK